MKNNIKAFVAKVLSLKLSAKLAIIWLTGLFVTAAVMFPGPVVFLTFLFVSIVAFIRVVNIFFDREWR